MKQLIKRLLKEGYDNLKSKDTTAYFTDIEGDTIKNMKYREVLYSTPNMQLVLMSLKPKEEIGEEVHDFTTQFLRFEEGTGEVITNGSKQKVKGGDCVIVPNGVKHNVINTSESDDLKLYTIYSPPKHPKDTIEKNKTSE